VAAEEKMADAVSTISALKVVLNAVAGIMGLIAAVLWWIASTRKENPMESFMVQDTIAHELRYPYLDRIASWNKWSYRDFCFHQHGWELLVAVSPSRWLACEAGIAVSLGA
jgi:hypothetical protein